MLHSDDDVPSKNPIETVVVDLYDRTRFLPADGIGLNEETAIMVQRATIKKRLRNIATRDETLI